MDWHSLPTSKVMKHLGTKKSGLSDKEAEVRFGKYGPNSIAIQKKVSPISIFINQFRNLLVVLLLIAAFVSFLISYLNPANGEYLDAILIFSIVIANAIFGFIQEYKAEKTMEALAQMSAPLATVIRNGREKNISSEEVVPGDILILEEGDEVAADALVIESYSLYSDQSMLTGESLPISKCMGRMEQRTPLAERSNMLFMNTVITRGRGRAVVVETGLQTEVGAIAKEIAEAPEKVTQFQLEIEDVGKKISTITFGILVVIASVEFFIRTGDILFVFIAAVALGVAAIPEGLPAVVTLALSIATSRMLKQKALMRRLSTVQDLGSVDVICTDKTGTLTENAMTVTCIYMDGISFEVSGKGMDREGKFISSIGGHMHHLDVLLKCAILCNDAREMGKELEGDPTEIAVLIPAYKAGIDVEGTRKKFKRLDEIPFSSERKMMSTINSDGKLTYSFVKGAPEVIISKCTHIRDKGKARKLSARDRKLLLQRNKKMASQALRVLAFAYKEDPESHAERDAESGLVYLGMMGMRDPPRLGVKEAVQDCRDAGIRVIMITGDNRYTAEAIGKELGFNSRTMTGDGIDSLSDEELSKVVEETDVYARTSPEHKVRLLKALKANEHIVCMTGDGVNDAGAIKNSDVGIAMGIRGTEVTKQASDLILLDDNFITIRNAVKEGRGSFDNIRKFVTLLLGANASEVIAVFLASISFIGLAPKIAAQLLWINLLTDGLPALALGVDAPSKDILKRKPRPKSERILNNRALYFIAWMGVIEALAVVCLYVYYFLTNDVVKAYTMFFTGFVVLENASVYLVRWRYKTSFFSNKWLHLAIAVSFALQLVILYTDASSWFGVVPLELIDWLVIALFGIVMVILIAVGLRLERFFLRGS